MRSESKKIIIGLTALPGGGKDYVADILIKEYGFYKISPGDIIREKMKKEGLTKITREEQQDIQNRWRKEHGPDYIMQLCYERMVETGKKRFVVPGIRFPRDIRFYRGLKDFEFYNIYIWALRRIRYSRTTERKRIDMPASFCEFVKHDRREEKIFNLKLTAKMSDFKLTNHINNDKSIVGKVGDMMKKIGCLKI